MFVRCHLAFDKNGLLPSEFIGIRQKVKQNLMESIQVGVNYHWHFATINETDVVLPDLCLNFHNVDDVCYGTF